MKTFLLVVALILSLPAFSQLTVTGIIKDNDDKVVPGTTIIFTSGKTTVHTITDDDGRFETVLPKTGLWRFETHGVGFDDTRQSYEFTNEKHYDLGVLRIEELVQQLQTVEVMGRMDRNYNSDYSFSATKFAINNKDLPQSIATVTKELIMDRQAFFLADAVKIASGVIPNSYYNQFAIRGISQNEEGTIINGMRTRQYYFNQPLTTNIERVEVIKGPASATFSTADPGGSINLVTKKPLKQERREISVSAGSFSTMRGTLDFTGPLNEKKTLLYRINGAYQEGKSFRDLQGQNAMLLSPSFSFVPNNKTQINTELIYNSTDGKIDRGQPIFGAVAGQTDLSSTPKSFPLNATNDFFKSKEVVLMANVAHAFTEHITFNTAYMKQTWTEDLLEHRTTNRFAVDRENNNVPTLAAMQAVERKQYWNIDNVNTYLNIDFITGALKHRMLVGYDVHSWHKVKGGGQNAARGYLLVNGNVAGAYDPAKADEYQMMMIEGVSMPKPNVPHFDLANPSYTIKNTNDYVFAVRTAMPAALTTTNALYVQELLSWNKLSVLLGLRHEWFKDITNYESNKEIIVTNQKWLPRVGITYAVTPSVNVYGTYLEGYQPQANTVTLMPVAAPSGSTFDPLMSSLKEVGAKMSFMANRLHLTTSVYEIIQKNILMNANDPVNPDLLVTRGEERSRGWEVDIAGYIIPELQVNASYSFIDAEILQDGNQDLIGKRKQNTPRHSGNVWTRYNFNNNAALANIGVGFGMQYSGNMVPWFTRDFTIPSFLLFDAALYYTPVANFQIALNVNNITNETYWIGAQNYLRLFPGAPRNMMLTATYKF